jgi:hypothetical protein
MEKVLSKARTYFVQVSNYILRHQASVTILWAYI